MNNHHIELATILLIRHVWPILTLQTQRSISRAALAVELLAFQPKR